VNDQTDQTVKGLSCTSQEWTRTETESNSICSIRIYVIFVEMSLYKLKRKDANHDNSITVMIYATCV
jgi:L-cystine uptake protein TcyP (sodium:dicarboxylate symporter family)